MHDPFAIVAENGTVVEPGGVYLTFSGDYDQPFKLAKIISIGGGPGNASMFRQIMPDLSTVQEPDLWVKLYYANFVDAPSCITSEILRQGFRIMPITPAVFLAWGPPKYPIRLGSEPVTDDELNQRVEDWYLRKTKPDCGEQPRTNG